jgi:hypothetical protein
MYFSRDFTADGGLISYGPNLAEAYHQVGVYAGQIVTLISSLMVKSQWSCLIPSISLAPCTAAFHPPIAVSAMRPSSFILARFESCRSDTRSKLVCR